MRNAAASPGRTSPRGSGRCWNCWPLGIPTGRSRRRLGVSEGTIRTHLENIYRRLGVTSRVAAVTRALGPDGPLG